MVTSISDWNDLNDIRNNLNEDYVLENDLTKSTAGYDTYGADWTPIVNFGGSLDGQSNSINNLNIDIRDRTADTPCGLFETWNHNEPVTVENLSIINANVKSATGADTFRPDPEIGTAILVGVPWNGSFPSTIDRTITNCTFTGNLEANTIIGSVAGVMISDNSTISNVYADITANFSTKDVSVIGGIVGRFEGKQIIGCTTNLELQSGGRIGGIVGGLLSDNPVEESFAKVNINISDNLTPSGVGGIAGDVADGNVISRCYAVGNIDVSAENVGGLIGAGGRFGDNTEVTDSYSAVSLTNSLDSTNVGGTFGNLEAGSYSATDVYWDEERSGTTNDAGTDTVPLTTSEMQGSSASTNMNFDFTNTWETVLQSDSDAGKDAYPILQSLDRNDQLILQESVPFWIIENDEIENVLEEERAFDSFTFSFVATKSVLRNLIRPATSEAGKVDVVPNIVGGFDTIDRVNGDNSISLIAPPGRRSVRGVDEWLVDEYEEEPLDTEAERWEVELELIPEKEKRYDNEYGSLSSPPSYSPSSTEWYLSFENGDILTDRVTTNLNRTPEDTLESVELEIVPSKDEVQLIEENLGLLNAQFTREIPDGKNVLVDESEGSRNTVTVDPPDGAENTVPAGDYVVKEFETEYNQSVYTITLVLVRK